TWWTPAAPRRRCASCCPRHISPRSMPSPLAGPLSIPSSPRSARTPGSSFPGISNPSSSSPSRSCAELEYWPVVDEPRAAEPGCREDPRGLRCARQRLQRVAVRKRHVIDLAESGIGEASAHLAQLTRRRTTIGERLGRVAQQPWERRRLPAFAGREVAVARRHGEIVRLAHRGHADDLGRDVEIARHTTHDLELLVILFAKI